MTMEQRIRNAIPLIGGSFMIATVAHHNIGDVSREFIDGDIDNLCYITKKDPKGEFYVGNWITGHGLINVRFPVDTTRELTNDEVNKFHGKRLSMGGMALAPLKIK